MDMLASHSRATVSGTAAIVECAALTATIHRTPRTRKSIHSRSRGSATANTGIASAITGQTRAPWPPSTEPASVAP